MSYAPIAARSLRSAAFSLASSFTSSSDAMEKPCLRAMLLSATPGVLAIPFFAAGYTTSCSVLRSLTRLLFPHQKFNIDARPSTPLPFQHEGRGVENAGRFLSLRSLRMGLSRNACHERLGQSKDGILRWLTLFCRGQHREQS